MATSPGEAVSHISRPVTGSRGRMPRSVTSSRPIVRVVLVRPAVFGAFGRLSGPGKLTLQRIEIGVMGVVLQLPGHLLLLRFRTAAPHGSTPSLHGRPGGVPLSGKLGHRRITSVPRREKHVHALPVSREGSMFTVCAAPEIHAGGVIPTPQTPWLDDLDLSLLCGIKSKIMTDDLYLRKPDTRERCYGLHVRLAGSPSGSPRPANDLPGGTPGTSRRRRDRILVHRACRPPWHIVDSATATWANSHTPVHTWFVTPEGGGALHNA
jgi:hypothetical protein